MPDLPFSPSSSTTWDAVSVRRRPLSLSWSRASVAVLVCATVIATAFRIRALDAYGFSDDEINKVRAIEQYRAGRFGANAEHPMLMKLAMWSSVEMMGAWNRMAPPHAAMSARPPSACRTQWPVA